MTYAVWNLGGGVCVGIEACDPEQGPVGRLTAAQLHRLATYVQLEIDIAQEDEERRARDPEFEGKLKAQSLRAMQRREELAELKNSIKQSAAKENEKLALDVCGEPRVMGGVTRFCDLPPGHAGDVHSVTLEELGGGTSQWPINPELDQQTVPEGQDTTLGLGQQPAASLDPTTPLFVPHDPTTPPDPARLVKRRESEQQKRDQLLLAGWVEHREIYDQNIPECWEKGGKWVDVHHAFEEMLSEKARAELVRQGWSTAEAIGDGVERWCRPGADTRRDELLFADALTEIGIAPTWLTLPRTSLDRQQP